MRATSFILAILILVISGFSEVLIARAPPYVPPTEEEIRHFALIQQDAANGFPNAQLIMGDVYSCNSSLHSGISIRSDVSGDCDFKKAEFWYLKAAEQDVAAAQRRLGWLYEHDHSDFPRNEGEAVKWYTRAAEQGDVKAQYDLAILFIQGKEGFEPRAGEGLKWLRRAAENGYVHAQTHLGSIYRAECLRPELAEFAQQDFQEAFKWYRMAADQGDTNAMDTVAGMYETGKGTEKDIAKAAKLYCALAAQGYKDAKTALRRLKMSCSPS